MPTSATVWALTIPFLIGAPSRKNTSLHRVQKLYKSLDFERVIRLSARILKRRKTKSRTRLEVLRLQASAFAVLNRITEAENTFRLLLRSEPDYQLSEDTPPKILAIFLKVRVEEQALRDQTRALERARLIKTLKFIGDPPSKPTGGQPIPFSYRVRDPRSVVAVVRVLYRRMGDKEYSSLPLKQQSNGDWTGAIPASWTANKSGFAMEYFVSTLDADDAPLLEMGAAAKPLVLPVLAGQVSTSKFYKTWWFWSLVAVVAVSSGTAAYLATQDSGGSSTDLGKFRLF